MSGVTGIYHLNGREVDRNLLKRMTRAIARRGPDNEGLFLSGHIGLGHRRLATVDLSEARRQPMVNEDGTLVIVHDGQVYNAPEIRKELEKTGYRFRSNSDTEVILYSYEKWGAECLEKFNGTWAFAIWDGQRNELFCARDHFGGKPLYYFFDGQTFVFASEIKALLEYPGLTRKVNEEVVYLYLMWGLPEHAENTFFKGIKALPPAHCMSVNPQYGVHLRQWWNLQFNPEPESLSENDIVGAAEHLRELLEDAIRIRLRSDVPIGTCLSGGLDSSSIVMLINRLILDESVIKRELVGDKQKTFSCCYEDDRFDERVFIEKVLQATGAESNYVFPDAGELWEELPRLIWHYDEPAPSGTDYAHWCLMGKVKSRGVKVVFDGDGGDVLFAGHYYEYGNFLLDLALKGKALRLAREAKQASAIIGTRNLLSVTGTTLGGALYTRLPLPLRLSIRNSLLDMRGRNTHKVLNPDFDKRFPEHGLDKINEQYGKSVANLQQSLHAAFLGLNRSLTQHDRSAAAFSLELRKPFTDYRLVEYSFSLPADLKIRDGRTKWILRQAMQGILPEEIRLRKDKIGFATPLRTWLWSNRHRIKELFSYRDLPSSQFINPTFIRDNLDDWLSRQKSIYGEQRAAQEIWRCLNLELWLQAFFGNQQKQIEHQAK